MKRRFLTLLFEKSDEFERFSFNFDMQAYLEICTSSVPINEQIVFRSTKGDDLALYLSNSIDIELNKKHYRFERKICVQNNEKTRFNASDRQIEQI